MWVALCWTPKEDKKKTCLNTSEHKHLVDIRVCGVFLFIRTLYEFVSLFLDHTHIYIYIKYIMSLINRMI